MEVVIVIDLVRVMELVGTWPTSSNTRFAIKKIMQDLGTKSCQPFITPSPRSLYPVTALPRVVSASFPFNFTESGALNLQVSSLPNLRNTQSFSTLFQVYKGEKDLVLFVPDFPVFSKDGWLCCAASLLPGNVSLSQINFSFPLIQWLAKIIASFLVKDKVLMMCWKIISTHLFLRPRFGRAFGTRIFLSITFGGRLNWRRENFSWK